MEQCHATCADGPLAADDVASRLRRALSTAWLATRREHDSRRALSLIELGSCLLFDQPSLERSALCQALDVRRQDAACHTPWTNHRPGP
jgi:hypothetical protein